MNGSAALAAAKYDFKGNVRLYRQNLRLDTLYMAAADRLGTVPDDATLANQKHVAALSQVRPDARTDKQVDSLVLATRQLDAFANLSPVEHHGLARVWTHDELGGGESLCRVNEQQPAYFIVVSGAMEVESQRLSHNLGENEDRPDGVTALHLPERTSGVSSSHRATSTESTPA